MSANQNSIDNETRHAIYINRVAGGFSKDFLTTIEAMKREVALKMAQQPLNQSNYERIIRELELIERQLLTSYTADFTDELNRLATLEAAWEKAALDDVLTSVTASVSLPASQQVWAAVISNPLVFPDSNDTILLEPFLRGWSDREVARVSNAIRTGFVTGQTNEQIAREIAGPDGLLDKQTRRANKAMVRTATNHTSALAREATMLDNDDIVIGYEWKSTLDDRTTAQCRSLDGQVFRFRDPGFKPKPPYHVNCRSVTVPVLDKRFAQDLSDATRPAVGPSVGRDGRGTVPANTTYYSFLKDQPAAFQDDVLGPKRGKLLRDGGLTAEEFRKLSVDEKFRPISLEEMQRRNAAAFERAGVKI